jgi:creatinine amidohydrolase/Fe(II)-dependent formamide hydrolase-like protein
MGHAKLTTTERYLHAKPRHTDVARLDRAFATQPALADPERQAAAAARE